MDLCFYKRSINEKHYKLVCNMILFTLRTKNIELKFKFEFKKSYNLWEFKFEKNNLADEILNIVGESVGKWWNQYISYWWLFIMNKALYFYIFKKIWIYWLYSILLYLNVIFDLGNK